MIFAYTRVSTNKQTTDSQINDLKNFGFDELFEDKISGKKFERPAFNLLIGKLRKGDIVVVWRLDRLGRSLINILKIIEYFKDNDIHFVSIHDGIDTRNNIGRLLIGLMATLSEYEHQLLSERRIAGINEARRKGIKMGRKKGLSDESQKKVKLVKLLYQNKNYTVQEILDQVKISRRTFYKYIKL